MALAALGPATLSTARADSETLWDVLARTDSATPLLAAETLGNTAPNALPATPQPVRVERRPLGPVPGFTIPVPAQSGEMHADALFGKKRSHGGLFGAVGDWFNRMQAATGTSIKVSGHHTLSLRMESISGNSDSYRDEQYYGRGSNGVYNDTDLTIDATLFKHLHYQTRISNSLFNNPNDNRVKLDYNTSKFRFEWGDLNAGFQGNSLIDFNRYLRGMQITSQWAPQFKSTLLYSQTKAETRTITIPGNDSSGPYYVYAGQIVEGSDHVRVDNRDLVKGQDYTLDTYTGELRFLNGNIVLQTSTIAVTFESLGYNQTQGSIYGFRTEFAPRKGPQLGLTYVTQQSRGSSGLQTRKQQWLGQIAAGEVLYLDAPADLSKPFQVTLGGLPLQKGVDYLVDANLLNQVRMVQGVPPGAILQIEYVPLNTSPTPGNRSVLGLDGRFSLGKFGAVKTEMALSGLSLLDNNYSGHAWQVNAELKPLRNLNTNLILRDVSPTFSSIQSPGFNRNERAVELRGDYTPIKDLRLDFDWQKARRPAYATSGVSASQFNISPIGNDDYSQYSVGLSYNFARNARLSLTRSSLGTDYAIGGNSSSVNDTLAFNYGLRAVTFEAALSRNRSLGYSLYTLSGGSAPQLSSYRSSTFSKRFGVNWQASRWLNLYGSVSDNDIANTGLGTDSRYTARDMQMTARLSLIRNLRLSYTYLLSDTGNAAFAATQTTNTGANGSPIGSPIRSALQSFPLLTREATSSAVGSALTSFPTQFGSGGYNYNLGGYGNYSGYYGSSVGTGYGVSSYGGKSRTNRFAIDYTPFQTVQIGLQFDTAESRGDYQYNSRRNNVGFNLGWQPSDRMQLNATYSVQKVAYNNGYGGTNSNTFLVSVQGHPFGGKLGVQLSWQSLQTDSTVNLSATNTTGQSSSTGPTFYNTNLSSLGLRLEHPLFRRQTLFLELFRTDSSGYLGSAENELRVGIDYALTQALKFSLGWQMLSRKNKDPQNALYDYSANSLLAEFGLRF